MKPEIEQLLKETLHKLQTDQDDDHLALIQTVLSTLDKEIRDPTNTDVSEYVEARSQWRLILCQNPQYRLQTSNDSACPLFIETLLELAQQDNHFKLQTNILTELGLSALAHYYPILSLKEKPLFDSIMDRFDQFQKKVFLTPFLSDLYDQIKALRDDKYPDYAKLTQLYNEWLLINSITETHPEEASLSPTSTNLPSILECSSEQIPELEPLFLHCLERHPDFELDTEMALMEWKRLEKFAAERMQTCALVLSKQQNGSKDEGIRAVFISKKACFTDQKTLASGIPLIQVFAKKQSVTLPDELPHFPKEHVKQKSFDAPLPDFKRSVQSFLESQEKAPFRMRIIPLALEHDLHRFLLPSDPWSKKRLNVTARRALFMMWCSKKSPLIPPSYPLIAFQQAKNGRENIPSAPHDIYHSPKKNAQGKGF